MKKTSIGLLGTEQVNLKTENLDIMPINKLINTLINEERKVIPAIMKAQKEMEKATNIYAQTLMEGGRILQVGSGCSGDYVQTDTMELPGTFSQSLSRVWGLSVQKGFYFNVKKDKEKLLEYIKQKRDRSEDSITQPIKDLEYMKFNDKDTLIALTASGRSPFLVQIAKEAKKRGGKVISIVMNGNTEISQYSDVCIEAIVGGAPISGSARMIAGTASKIIITTLSTAAHVLMGGVYSNLMVDLNVKDNLDNSKFIDRASRIISLITKETPEESYKLLEKANWNIKVACIMKIKNVSQENARKLLNQNKNNLRRIIG